MFIGLAVPEPGSEVVGQDALDGAPAEGGEVRRGETPAGVEPLLGCLVVLEVRSSARGTPRNSTLLTLSTAAPPRSAVHGAVCQPSLHYKVLSKFLSSLLYFFV
jgi:hypothetical protein